MQPPEAATPAEPPPSTAPTANGTTSSGHGRRRLPDSLPRQRVVHELSHAERACPDCGHERTRIREEVSEQLDYQPAALFVTQHVRGVYACPHCEGQVATAAKPEQPIDKGLPGPGLLAQIITSKYGDHLPLHRLERIFARHGLELARSTTCGWMAACAERLGPLVEWMRAEVLQSHVLHTDDTVLPVLDKSREQTRQGRLWVYLGDRDHPYVVFDYTPNHARDGPARVLADYHGYLQADAFSGYDGIYLGSGGAILEVACNAHARRKFYEARTSDAARSHAALAWYRQLYAVEHTATEQIGQRERAAGAPVPATEAEALRLELRQRQALPVLTDFHGWLVEQQRQVLPKSPMGQAIAYALKNWTALCRYTEAGCLSIDNNAAEREMKKIALGRKNFLFAGSDTGGQTAAVLFSLISSCQRHALDPFAYLREVLTQLPALPAERLSELLPDRWAKAHTEPPA